MIFISFVLSWRPFCRLRHPILPCRTQNSSISPPRRLDAIPLPSAATSTVFTVHARRPQISPFECETPSHPRSEPFESAPSQQVPTRPCQLPLSSSPPVSTADSLAPFHVDIDDIIRRASCVVHRVSSSTLEFTSVFGCPFCDIRVTRSLLSPPFVAVEHTGATQRSCSQR